MRPPSILTFICMSGLVFATSEARAPQTAARGPSEAKPIQLPSWTPTKDTHRKLPVLLSAKQSPEHIWGHGTGLPTFYVDEFLTAFFQRTLAIHQVELGGGALEWVFTGDEGGITISVTDKELEVQERFYESPGFRNIVEGPRTRHPEYISKTSRLSFTGAVQAVSVTLDHRLYLRVALNGQEVFQSTCAFDLTRHQIRLTSVKGNLRAECLFPESVSCTVEVNSKNRHQTMIGFGGITTPTAYAQLSREGRRRWWELLCEYNLLIQREYPIGTRLNPETDNWQRLADAMPHYYGDNFPNGEVSDFDYIRTLRKLDGKVFFEFWMLPPWTTQDWRDPAGKLRKGVVDPAKYVEAMLAYCRASRERAGAPPEVVGIQNERQQPLPLWSEMTSALRKGLDEAGFRDVRIHMSDAGSLGRGIEWLEQLRGLPRAWADTDFVASHMYDYQGTLTDPDQFDKRLLRWKELSGGRPFLSTELCVNSDDYQWKSYRLAFSMGQLYHKNLVLTDASAICYCWTLLNVVQPSYGWSRTLFVPDPSQGFTPRASSHQLRVYGAFSRRVREGMVRVDARSDDPDLLVSAFVGSKGERTMILLNRGVVSRTVSDPWPGVEFTWAELVDPYHAGQVFDRADGVGGRNVLPPGSILTLTDVPLRSLPDGFEIEGSDGKQ